MSDSIVSRIVTVDAATAQEAQFASAYQAAQVALSTAQTQYIAAKLATAGARKSVHDGLVSLGHPVFIINPDGTESVVEILGTADYSIALTVSGEQNIPS